MCALRYADMIEIQSQFSGGYLSSKKGKSQNVSEYQKSNRCAWEEVIITSAWQKVEGNFKEKETE